MADVFRSEASQWWDKSGSFGLLHKMNPKRLAFLKSSLAKQTSGLRVLDVGCGGGLFSEALAIEGHHVTGIDQSPEAIEAAKSHALIKHLDITYTCSDWQSFPEDSQTQFDLVCVLELLEHVSQPLACLSHINRCLSDHGYCLVSTINRSHLSYWLGIIAAEKLLGWVPEGAHDHQWFIKPSELVQYSRQLSWEVVSMTGLVYQPLSGDFSFSQDMSINYMILFKKV